LLANERKPTEAKSRKETRRRQKNPLKASTFGQKSRSVEHTDKHGQQISIIRSTTRQCKADVRMSEILNEQCRKLQGYVDCEIRQTSNSTVKSSKLHIVDLQQYVVAND